MIVSKKKGINISKQNISKNFRKALDTYQAERQLSGVRGNGLGNCLATLAEIGHKKYQESPESYFPENIEEEAEKGINAGKISGNLYSMIVSTRNEIKNREKKGKAFTIDRIFIMLAEIGLKEVNNSSKN